MKINFLNFFSPSVFISRFCFCYGGNSAGGQGDNKSSTSTTDASTNTTVSTTNEQVGASEGSIAIGANANVNMLDGGAVKDALFFAGHNSDNVTDIVKLVLAQSKAVVDRAPTTASELNTALAGVSSVVSENLKSANSTADTAGNKNLIVSLAVVAAIVGGLFIYKTR